MVALSALIAALWLGILTSISPCPLATNIAAMSYIGRSLGRPALTLWTGLLYTAGRALTYIVLGMLLVHGLLAAPLLSQWLQKYMAQLLGPLLIVVGMLLLELIPLPALPGGVGDGVRRRAEALGVWGGGLLGVVFALTFCPVSAALFFGGLLPLAVQHRSGFTLPLFYGVGTGLPVVVFAGLLAAGAHGIGTAFNCLSRIEWWARHATGVVFIGIGLYYVFTTVLLVGV